MRLSLPVKTGFATLILGTLATLVVAYIAFVEAEKIFYSYGSKLTKQILEKKAHDLKQVIDKTKQDLLYIRQSQDTPALIRAKKSPYLYDKRTNTSYKVLRKRMEKLFEVILTQNRYYQSITMLDPQEKVLINISKTAMGIERSTELNLDTYNQELQILSAMKTGEDHFYVSTASIFKNAKTQQAVIFVAKPLYRKKHMEALYVIRFNLKALIEDIFSDIHDKEAFIISKSGAILFHKKNDQIEVFNAQNPVTALDEGIDIQSIRENKIYESVVNGMSLYSKPLNLSNQNHFYIAIKNNQSIMKGESHAYLLTILSTIILVVTMLGVLVAIIISKLTRGISLLTQLAARSSDEMLDPNEFRKIKTKDEIETLAFTFANMLESLSKSQKKLQEFAHNLELEVDKKTKELQAFNQELSQKIEEGVNELRHKDSMLIQQSKMAAMGEMIGSIAHQWRQPLNALALSIQEVEDSYELGKIDLEYLEEFVDSNMELIHYMSHTIDDFRNFFKPDKEKARFSIKQAVENVRHIQSAQLNASHVNLSIEGEDFYVNGFENEFKQVVLNIINNARDQLDTLELEEKHVRIHLSRDSEKGYGELRICDNGGGIPEAIIDRLFDPYFTTKDESTGTGLGLYMSKMIIEQNMQGKLNAFNEGDGACFSIVLECE